MKHFISRLFLSPLTFRNTAILFLVIFFSVGAAGTINEGTRRFFLALFPLALLISFGALITFSETSHAIKTYIALFTVMSAGFLIEVFGVRTGKLFGIYSYGDTLGIKLLDTPLVIGLNWAMLVLMANSISDRITGSLFPGIIIAPLIMVGYDIFLEQIAPLLGMWIWKDNIIPLRNYAAWFFISLMFTAFLRILKIRFRSSVDISVFTVHIAFFMVLLVYFRFIQ